MVSTQDLKLSLAAGELKQPLHVKVRQILREQILTEFKHGQRFYSERELMQKLNVSQATVRRAIQDLVGEGYLQTDPRRGFFIQRHKEVQYVGLVIPAQGDHLEAEYISYCRGHNHVLDVHAFHKSDTADDILGLIKHKPSEERILMMGLTVELTLELGSHLQSRGYQHIFVGAKLSGFTGGSISFDHEGEVDQILDYLTGLGHKRICFIVNEPRNLLITSLRAEAVQKKLQERGLTKSQNRLLRHAELGQLLRRRVQESRGGPRGQAGADRHRAALRRRRVGRDALRERAPDQSARAALHRLVRPDGQQPHPAHSPRPTGLLARGAGGAGAAALVDRRGLHGQ
jgi:DNA-binding transcriptional regulator YhcF (GntR family)